MTVGEEAHTHREGHTPKRDTHTPASLGEESGEGGQGQGGDDGGGGLGGGGGGGGSSELDALHVAAAVAGGARAVLSCK